MNDYYNPPDNTPTAYSLARSTVLRQQFAAIGAAFDKFPTLRKVREDRINYIETPGGTANAITVTLDPAPSDYQNGLRILVKPANSNTGATTINVNGLGAVQVVDRSGAALVAGAIFAGHPVDMVYQGGVFRLLSSGADVAAAAASASAASASAAAAEAARDATLQAYDSFDDRYLGSKTSDPALDNDGNPLVGGAIYYNSVAQEMRLWTGSAWVAAYVSGGTFLPLTGGTMTGLLTLAAAFGVRYTPGAAPGAPADGQTWREAGAFKHHLSGTTYDIVLAALTQALTNKTINLASNTLTGTRAQFNTAMSDDDFATLTGNEKLQNKRIKKRIVPAGATSGALTPNCDTTDTFKAAGLTGAVTINAPTGTPDEGDELIITLEDNGTARGITWTTSAGGFRAAEGVALPTSTTLGKVLRLGFIWDSDGYWDNVALVKQG